MRIAAISDLHIGASEKMDTFRHNVSSFQRFLDRLEKSHDRIILLGDIYQCDHGLLPRVCREQLHSARDRSSWLTQRLHNPAYTLVRGNHDDITAAELGAPETVVEDGALLTHGDRFDPIVGGAPRLALAASWMNGLVRRVGLHCLSRWMEGRDVSLKHRSLQTPKGPYAAAARHLMQAHGVRFVVFGHTHIPWRLELPEGILLNTGTCSRGQRMFASIDTLSHSARIVIE